jgi:hypothetical protein
MMGEPLQKSGESVKALSATNRALTMIEVACSKGYRIAGWDQYQGWFPSSLSLKGRW